MHPFHHGGVLGSHETSSLGPRNPKSVKRFGGAQLKHLGSGSAGGECPGGGAGMKSSAQLGCSASHSNTAADFIAGDDRSQKTLAVNVPSMTHEGIGRRYRLGAGVDDADSMKVV